MQRERHPAENPDSFRNKDFWKHLKENEKSTALYRDTVYNKSFIRNMHGVWYGMGVGLFTSLLLVKVRSRFAVASISAAVSCGLLNNKRIEPVYAQYNNVWEAVKNDAVLQKIASETTKNYDTETFHYFYNRYLRFYLKDNGVQDECSLC